MTAAHIESAERREDTDDGPIVGPWSRSLVADEMATPLGRTVGAWRELTRRELRLPTATALVGSGHQATFWHPGVAMKPIAADEMAKRIGGSAWHLVVDSDAHPIGMAPTPVRDADGTLREAIVEIGHDGVSAGETPTGRRPPLTVPDRHSERPLALPSVATGIAGVRSALRQFADEPDAAMQVTRANLALLAPLLERSPQVVRSSSLLGTTLGRTLVERMREDPRRCAESYNRAVTAVHGAGATLAVDDRIELPLWHVGADAVRRRTHADDLAGPIDEGTLLPRALLLTAIVRLGAADLFVHGTGGMAYDAAMERWLLEWLGVTPRPACLVTATLRLPLPENDVPADIVDRAIARRRRVWWDPQLHVAAHPSADHPRPVMATKRALVDAIASAPRNSPERAQRYRDLQRLLAELRGRAADAISAAERDLVHARRLAAGRPLAMSRTWPFPFHEPDALRELASTTRRAVADADDAAKT